MTLPTHTAVLDLHKGFLYLGYKYGHESILQLHIYIKGLLTLGYPYGHESINMFAKKYTSPDLYVSGAPPRCVSWLSRKTTYSGVYMV